MSTERVGGGDNDDQPVAAGPAAQRRGGAPAGGRAGRRTPGAEPWLPRSGQEDAVGRRSTSKVTSSSSASSVGAALMIARAMVDADPSAFRPPAGSKRSMHASMSSPRR